MSSVNLRPLSWVRQEDSCGCVLASIAMITGKSYQEIKAMVSPIQDFSQKGLGGFEENRILVELGFSVERKFIRSFEGKSDEREWPPKPFAGLHICSVEVYQGAPLFHAVVMLADGTVMDPATPEPKRLSDYFRVCNVFGVSRT